MVDRHSAKPLVIPALGKQTELGALYNARTNSFYDGLSAWSAEDVEKNQIVRQCPHTDFSLSTNNTERDEKAGLDVEGSVSLKLKLFDVSGSARYLNETKKHAFEARVDASCRVKTREKTMPSDQLMNWKYDEILQNETTHISCQRSLREEKPTCRFAKSARAPRRRPASKANCPAPSRGFSLPSKAASPLKRKKK